MTQTITAIKPTQRSPGRMSIYVERKFIGALPIKRIEELGLTVGQAWDDTLASRLEATLAGDKALRYAVRLLSRRAYSRGEIIDRCRRKDYGAAAIEIALESLDRMNLLDDAAYGRAIIEATGQSKPAGRRLLQHKLFQKKLDGALIAQLLDEAESQADPIAEIKQLAKQRLATASMQRCDSAAKKRRLWDYLSRRGYDAESIRSVMTTLPLNEDDA